LQFVTLGILIRQASNLAHIITVVITGWTVVQALC